MLEYSDSSNPVYFSVICYFKQLYRNFSTWRFCAPSYYHFIFSPCCVSGWITDLLCDFLMQLVTQEWHRTLWQTLPSKRPQNTSNQTSERAVGRLQTVSHFHLPRIPKCCWKRIYVTESVSRAADKKELKISERKPPPHKITIYSH